MTEITADTKEPDYPGSPLQFWACILAFATALTVLLMISVGADVTTTQAGDSDPTWTWQFWTWFQRVGDAPGGLQHELGHRVIGTILGFEMMGLCLLIWFGDTRRWLKILVTVVLVMVIVQGLVGALRVLVVPDSEIRDTIMEMTGGGHNNTIRRKVFTAIHAVHAHAIFSLISVIALATTSGWIRPPKQFPSAGTRRTRRLAVMTLSFLFLQVILGAFARHFPGSVSVHIHMTWAFIVIVHTVLLSNRTNKEHHEAFPVRQLAALLMFLSIFQAFIGFGAWMMTLETTNVPPVSLANLIRSGHVATGATLLAITSVIVMRCFHLLQVAEPTADAT